MESDAPGRSSSVDSLEDVTSADKINGEEKGKKTKQDLWAPIYIEKDLDLNPQKAGGGRDVTKFRLPTQAVNYVPQGNLELATEKTLNVSAKALFHILFGDSSGVWQLFLHERRAQGKLYSHG